MSTMSIEGRGWRVVIETQSIEVRSSGPHYDRVEYVKGPMSGTITGLRPPHYNEEIEAYLQPSEITVIKDALRHTRGMRGGRRACEKFVDRIVRSILFNMPTERIYAWRQTTRF